MKITINMEDDKEIETFYDVEDAIEYLRDYEARQARRNFEFNYTYERPYFKQIHSVSKNAMFLKEILADLKELGYVCTYEGATGYTYEKS